MDGLVGGQNDLRKVSSLKLGCYVLRREEFLRPQGGRIDGQMGSDVPGRIAAHAVRHNPEITAVDRREDILIGLSHVTGFCSPNT
jgi:hypothetical protein